MSPPLAPPPSRPGNPIGRWWRGYGLFAALCLLWLLSTFSAFWFDGLLAWAAGLLYVGYDTWLLGYVAWQTRDLARLQASSGSQGRALDVLPALGIVVPARNEATVLAATLDPLLAQLRPGDTLLLVDDGSSDHTRALLQQHYGVAPGEGLVSSTRHAALQVLFKPNSGKADSLNAGWQRLAQPVIVTIDADTRLAPEALQGFREAFAREPALAAACGILEPRTQGGLSARLFQLFQRFEYLRAFLSRAAWMQSDALLLVSGAFAGYRREALERIGGFDPQCLVEDYELIHRLHQTACEQGLGWTVRVLAAPRAITDAPADVQGFLRQRRRWFAGFLQTQFRYRLLHGDVRYGAVGRLMLPVKAVDTLQPVFGLTAFVLLVAFVLGGARVAPLVLLVIAVKLAIDFSYHFWALRQYHRWLELPLPRAVWGQAAFATLAEPFSFQLLRHCGAAWGWWLILTGQRDWAPQRRPTALPPPSLSASPLFVAPKTASFHKTRETP